MPTVEIADRVLKNWFFTSNSKGIDVASNGVEIIFASRKAIFFARFVFRHRRSYSSNCIVFSRSN